MADFTGKRNGPDYTVDIMKPKKKQLTLDDLQQANSGVPGRYADPADPGVGGDPVAEANAFLTKKSVLDRPSFRGTPGAAEMVEPPAQKAWREANEAMGHDITQSRKGLLRRTTEGMNQLGDVANVGALATTPMAAFGVPEPAIALGGLGGLLKLADPLRRAYQPQMDESEPGVGEAVQTGVNLLPLTALKSLGAAAPIAEEVPGWAGGGNLRKTFGLRQAEELPYRMGSSVQPAERVVNPISRDWLSQTLGKGRGTGLTQDIVDRGRKFGLRSSENAWESLGDINGRNEGLDLSRRATASNAVGDMVNSESRPVPGFDPRLSFEGSGPEAAFAPTSSVEGPAGWNTLGKVPNARSVTPEITQLGNLSIDRPLKTLQGELTTAKTSGDAGAIDQLTRAIKQQQLLRRKTAERAATSGSTSHGPTAEYFNGRRYDIGSSGDAQSAAKRSKGNAMRAFAAKKGTR